VEADAEQITIEIRDHGRGMPREILEQVGDGTRLGVGLAGMRERIHELVGEFEVKSDENGTTIRATVPFSVRQEGQPVSSATDVSASRDEEEREERIANAFWRPRGGAS
jgi:signal transduction histidine kinase